MDNFTEEIDNMDNTNNITCARKLRATNGQFVLIILFIIIAVLAGLCVQRVW